MVRRQSKGFWHLALILALNESFGKTVADVVEAIVGAAFLNNGIENALRVMHVLRFNMPEISEYSDFWRLYAPHAASHKTLHKLPTSTIKTVEEITGYEFHASSLLAEALVCDYDMLTMREINSRRLMAQYRASRSQAMIASSFWAMAFWISVRALNFSHYRILIRADVVWYAFKAYPSLSPGGLSLLKVCILTADIGQH